MWKGNTTAAEPGFRGTDRAYDPALGTTDPARVYGSTTTTCLRSDSAEIESAVLLVQKRINLACGGAVTQNVLRAASGGVGLSGEAPQNDQLLEVAKAHRVRLVTLSIGGNDLGFPTIVSGCVSAYLFGTAPCAETQGAQVRALVPQVEAAVGRTLADVRATMAAAGYAERDYRLVLQTYPQPQAASAYSRYSGPDAEKRRLSDGGCPFYDRDLEWSRTEVSPALNAALIRAARANGAQVLDLTDTLKGHELCSADTVTSDGTPAARDSEWVRFIDTAPQGTLFESLHPNHFGQLAIGRCLTLAVAAGRDVACDGAPRSVPASVRVRPLAS